MAGKARVLSLGMPPHWATNNTAPGHTVPKIRHRNAAQNMGLLTRQIVNSGEIDGRVLCGIAIGEEHDGSP